MSTPAPTTGDRSGLQPKTDRRTLITFALAVPAIIIFATGLLGMNFLMALILGAIIGLRILFPDDRRVLVVVIVLAIGWAILLPFTHDEGGDFMNIATLILAYSVMALGLNIIVGFADSVVTRIDDLQRLLTRERIDKATTITVLRDGVQTTRWIMPRDDDRARRA